MLKKQNYLLVILALMLTVFMVGCSSMNGNEASEKKQEKLDKKALVQKAFRMGIIQNDELLKKLSKE